MTQALLDYGEERFVEQPAMDLLAELGWQVVDAMQYDPKSSMPYKREAFSDVVLMEELLEALAELNPDIPSAALKDAALQVAAPRPDMELAAANREVYDLLRAGVTVSFVDSEGEPRTERVSIIDWEAPCNNRFLAVNQLWMVSPDGLYTRRPDIVGFVNGLPLVLIELKATHVPVREAYDQNLRDYRDTLPQLFEQNALLVASNGTVARLGSITAGWEHFSDWKKVAREDEPKRPGLETLLRGVMDKERLLDIVENFILYSETEGGLTKIVAMNHQYLGVNSAIEALKYSKENGGKLGVFWHTQGSGKSFSMVFFSQKVLRKVRGNWSFVVVTDRDELDDQIYKTFARSGSVQEPAESVRASSGQHLRELLQQDHRYLFTLIQKFHAPKGEAFPPLSDRSDVIVMTDEAHRSQYDIFAGNMRSALPNAAFIGFTGTPLMDGEEKTREVFGDYVSIYNFSDAVDDGATVPLYYENRIPELQLTNSEFQEEMEAALEAHAVDEEAEQEVQRRFGKQYQLIVRPDRLDAIADDLVQHFLSRGQFGKAMVVSIDKATAVRMYDRVQSRWQDALAGAKAELQQARGEAREPLLARIKLLEETDMAVVVSQAQNEIDDFRKLGLEIAPHRKRMRSEDLEERFKNPNDPLSMVFVCAMWMTGFDAPSVSTIYLDKPMRNHTLMQTIARANRVWEQKKSGLIVDYIGVFKDLEKALAIYGGAATEGAGDRPVQPKEELLAMLQAQLTGLREFLRAQGVDIEEVLGAEGFDLMQTMADVSDTLLKSDAVKNSFVDQARALDRLYRGVLPDPSAQQYAREWALYQALLRNLLAGSEQKADIAGVMARVEELMDRSVMAFRYEIPQNTQALDLSKVDFEALAERFAESPHKFTEAEKLRRALGARVAEMTRLNRTRVDFAEQLQRMIDEYNTGAPDVQNLYSQLLAFGQSLDAEGERAAREGLSEEELAIFDLVMKPGGPTGKRDEKAVKAMARQLIAKLNDNVLVLDWRKKQQTRARVRKAVRDELRALGVENGELSDLVGSLYAHIHDAYPNVDKSVYA